MYDFQPYFVYNIFKGVCAHFSTHLISFTYVYLIRIIIFTINNLFSRSFIVPSMLCDTTIQLNISHLFTHS